MKKILLALSLLSGLALAQTPIYRFGPMTSDSLKAHGLGADSSVTPKSLTLKALTGSGNGLATLSSTGVVQRQTTIAGAYTFSGSIYAPILGAGEVRLGSSGAPGEGGYIKHDGATVVIADGTDSDVARFSASGNVLYGPLQLPARAGTGNRLAYFTPGGDVRDTAINAIMPTPTFASTLTALQYTVWSNAENYQQNTGVICNTNMLCIANEDNPGTPPATPGNYLDNGSTYDEWNVFSSYETYERFKMRIVVGL